MDCGELAIIRQAEGLVCTASGFFIGPTGPVGPAATDKIFTIYLDFSSGSAISRVYIPRGLSRASSLANGGVFTGDVGTDLVISGTTLTINDTVHPFPIGLSATGYIYGGHWELTAGSQIGGSGANWNNTADNRLNLVGLTPGFLNGGNSSNRPSSGVLSGWLATLTIYYL
jgi:hypothetical protein